MHWEVLIIPLIALGVWIIGTLFKNEDEKIKRGVVRRPPFNPPNAGGKGGGRPPGRRVVTDLDRFLEEARRRREPEDRRKAPAPSRTPPARPPLRERPTPRQEPPPFAVPASVPEEAVVLPVPRPAAQPPSSEPAPNQPVPMSGERKLGRLLARETPPPPAPAACPTPIAQQVRSLLSKPQTAATAFVLREIFDRPLCRRRR